MEGNNFSMRAAGLPMIPFSDNTTFVDNDGSNHWVGAGPPPALGRETKSEGHTRDVLSDVDHRLEGDLPGRDFFEDFDRDVTVTADLILGMSFFDV